MYCLHQKWEGFKHEGHPADLIHTFAVCRTVSSERMSKCPNGVSLFCRALTTRELKPQRGESGVPFMRSMTGWLLISSLTLSTAASLV